MEEQEYQTKLSRLEKLLDGSFCAELELLSREIEAYEQKHYPFESPSPEELKEWRRENLTPEAFAEEYPNG